jgi:hypothetical protein
MNMEEPNKENTLYLPIKQVYYDQIINGTKDKEYRMVGYGITANRYLLKDKDKHYILNAECTESGKEYSIDDYNNGNFPFMPKPYKYLYIAVGYAKQRDTATLEVTDITFEPAERIRGGLFCSWNAVYHIGKIIEFHRVDKTK